MLTDDYPKKIFILQTCSYAILGAFAIIFVALRLYVKVRIIRNVGKEDFALMAALLCSIVALFPFFYEVHVARQGINVLTIEKRLKCVYSGGIVYNISLAFTKISFLLQYLRIFHYKSMRIAIWILFAVVVIYCGWGFFQSIIPCWPISNFWKVFTVSNDCVDAISGYTAHAALNVATDIFILILPIPGLKKLMLPRAQKVGLILVFALGGLTCVASTLRLGMLAGASNGVLFTRWAGLSVGNWSAIEMNVAIVCCCLPPLRPLATRLWRKVQQGKRLEHSRRFISSRLSGLSSFISSSGKILSFSSPSSSSKSAATATPSRSKSGLDGSTPGELSCGTKSEGSDSTICSNANTDNVGTNNKAIRQPTNNHGAYSCAFDDVVVAAHNNNGGAGSSGGLVTATPNTSSHDCEKLHGPSQCPSDHRFEHSHGPDNDSRAGGKGQTSWLSMNETVYDECDDVESSYGFSRCAVYAAGAPGSAV